MPSANITVVPYVGTRLPTHLLSPDATLVLKDFGTPMVGEVVTVEDRWSSADDGLSTFCGRPVTYIGTGTARAGMVQGTRITGTGAEVTVVLFAVGDHIFFYYPDGEPASEGQIATILNAEAVPYDGITPVCFTLGTLISTPEGEVPVEDLAPGDRVLATDGTAHPLRCVFRRHFGLTNQMPHVRRRLLPVLLPKDALGRGLPYRDLRLSQQHLVCLEHAAAQLYFSEREVLVPARALVGDHIRLDHDMAAVSYFQLLCDSHVVVRANGLPAATLRIGAADRSQMTPAQQAELNEVFPGLAKTVAWMPAALPVLSTAEGRVLRAAMVSRRRLH
ncbi:Hint domain-containing protein [Pseudooceanicola nanhaiensis]|uniref:Hint domain-containing protein n=1 Tax=Pseudooceanicola nanhaiensis TaxID=375761 RepID=UPI001CD3919B|nr:Hint domain-containing protein [Pseudooceanicola nanhaiensis]MCA0919987.1 Hint domain-containing protein [Pseudooceanicola nanhaiensis]